MFLDSFSWWKLQILREAILKHFCYTYISSLSLMVWRSCSSWYIQSDDSTPQCLLQQVSSLSMQRGKKRTFRVADSLCQAAGLLRTPALSAVTQSDVLLRPNNFLLLFRKSELLCGLSRYDCICTLTLSERWHVVLAVVVVVWEELKTMPSKTSHTYTHTHAHAHTHTHTHTFFLCISASLRLHKWAAWLDIYTAYIIPLMCGTHFVFLWCHHVIRRVNPPVATDPFEREEELKPGTTTPKERREGLGCKQALAVFLWGPRPPQLHRGAPASRSDSQTVSLPTACLRVEHSPYWRGAGSPDSPDCFMGDGHANTQPRLERCCILLSHCQEHDTIN